MLEKFKYILISIMGLLNFLFITLGLDVVLKFLKINNWIINTILTFFFTIGFMLIVINELKKEDKN